jgi:o-succinylbenzoate synthase
MKIVDITLSSLYLELKVPFVTALRRVTHIDDVIVTIITDDGLKGLGEAPPTKEITGETKESISTTILEQIKPNLIGRSLEEFDQIVQELQHCCKRNTSAKAAVDIALYDLQAQYRQQPLYTYLGGHLRELKTDITISLNAPSVIVEDAKRAVNNGFDTLKIKVGGDAKEDIERLKAITHAFPFVKLRVDANQGWSLDQAKAVIEAYAREALPIEFIEQPSNAHDFDTLKVIKTFSPFPIMADESIFSLEDAKRLFEMEAVDLINIKLMKTGGITNALAIYEAAQKQKIDAMIGSMLEGAISVGAAAHLAMAKEGFRYIDLDAPLLAKTNPYKQRLDYERNVISLI